MSSVCHGRIQGFHGNHCSLFARGERCWNGRGRDGATRSWVARRSVVGSGSKGEPLSRSRPGVGLEGDRGHGWGQLGGGDPVLAQVCGSRCGDQGGDRQQLRPRIGQQGHVRHVPDAYDIVLMRALRLALFTCLFCYLWEGSTFVPFRYRPTDIRHACVLFFLSVALSHFPPPFFQFDSVGPYTTEPSPLGPCKFLRHAGRGARASSPHVRERAT